MQIRSVASLAALGTFVLGGVTALSAGGCGGSSSPASTSQATLTIMWPSRARVIPAAANSIRVTLRQGETLLGEQVVPRPASGAPSVVRFDQLPEGSAIATATAYPNADGTGVALAVATVPITLTLGQNTDFTVTLASTIDHLEVTAPASPLAAGTGAAVSVLAKDSRDAIVPLTPSRLQWASSQPGVATVDGSGNVAAVAMGTTTIQVTDTESTRSASATVRVFPVVAVTPAAATISVRASRTFSATVTGASGTGVTWSVAEGPAGGSITADGLYTAPPLSGTYHVLATSQADPNQTATAALTVLAGSATGTVQ